MPNLLNLPFMRKPSEKDAPAQKGAATARPEPPSDDELRLKVYRLIIDRYRDKIEEYEAKSVSDLKGMVRPHDQKIAEIRITLTEAFHPYVYEEHFLQAAKMAFEYVSTFHTLSLPVSFWLDFSEMQSLLSGDEIDKSILFCSLLRSLGSENAKVVVTDSRNSHAIFEFGGKSFVADHSKTQLAEFQSEAAAKASLNGKPLYSFNDKEYDDFQEAE